MLIDTFSINILSDDINLTANRIGEILLISLYAFSRFFHSTMFMLFLDIY